MQIVRESNQKTVWSEISNYVESFYNISVNHNGKIGIFNAATGAVAIMDSDELTSLSPDQMLHLVENGFLIPEGMQEFEYYISKISILKKKKPDYFTIIPTTACNAKCFYCYEESYCKKTIDDNSIHTIIEYLRKQLEHDAACVLDWYGGEPLLCIKQIDQIISVLKKDELLLNRWSSSITTNGTLLSSDVVNHLVKDWHLKTAHITIDGTEDEHNKRKLVALKPGESAYQKTYNGVYELLSAGVYVNLRIHLDRNNKGSFKEMLQELSGLFHFENLHLFPTFLFPPEHKMPDNYIKDSEKEELFYNVFKTLLESDYRISLRDMFPYPRLNGCFATKPNTIVIAPDGSLHSCVQDFDINYHVETNKFCDFRYALDYCRECKYLPICLGGCLYNRNIEHTVRTPCVRNRFVIKPMLKLLLDNN